METFIADCVAERVNPDYHWISNGYDIPLLLLNTLLRRTDASSLDANLSDDVEYSVKSYRKAIISNLETGAESLTIAGIIYSFL